MECRSIKAADVQEHVISEQMGHAVDSLSVGRYVKKLEPEKLRANVERLVLLGISCAIG